MEVFTVSVGIGRVAISVRQTRQVVSRLHAEIYHELGSMPIIISVLRYQGSRRYVAVPGGFPPSAHTCMGHCYLSFPALPISRGPDALNTSALARTLPDSLSPYQGMLFKPFGLVDPLNFEGSDGPQTSAPLDRLRESRAPLPDGRTPPIPARYLNVVAWWRARTRATPRSPRRLLIPTGRLNRGFEG